MAKPKTGRVYEAGLTEYGAEELPARWTFPMLVVPCGVYSKLGIAVVQPIDLRGQPAGGRLTLEIKMMKRFYRVRRGRNMFTPEQYELIEDGKPWMDEDEQ